MLYFGSSHSIVTRGSRVSPALLHHILPAFLNLSGNSNVLRAHVIFSQLGNDCPIILCLLIHLPYLGSK